MRAVRFYGKEDIRIDELLEPVCKPCEVIVAPSHCGICGTDLHEYINGPHEYPAEPHPLTGECVPLTLGPEFSGVVIETGSDARDLKVGDRVVVHGTLACGKCEPCRTGNRHVCIMPANVGQHGRGGGLAEKVACEESWCYKLPEHVGLDIGALCEPLAVCGHAIRQLASEPQQHQTALVLGCGAIGLGIVQLLRARGLKQTVVSEMSHTRRRAALDFGASHAFNPKEVDVVEQVRRLTDRAGPHLVFECAGAPASMQTAISVVRIHGSIIGVALLPPSFTLDSNPLVHKEASYKGSLSHKPEDWKSVIGRLDDESLQPQSLITQIIPLENVVEEGIMGLARADEGLVKILVEVNPPERLKTLVGHGAY